MSRKTAAQRFCFAPAFWEDGSDGTVRIFERWALYSFFMVVMRWLLYEWVFGNFEYFFSLILLL